MDSKKISDNIPESILIDQFDNHANVEIHFKTTGPEIIRDLNGKVDYFFSTVGTGGTITGTSMCLKNNINNVYCVGVDPNGGIYHKDFYNMEAIYEDHFIESISDDFISNNYDKKYIDEFISVSDYESFSTCYEILRKEGLCVGTSSGCALAGVKKFLKNNPNVKGNIVVILPDTGIKYASTLYNKQWLFDNLKLII